MILPSFAVLKTAWSLPIRTIENHNERKDLLNPFELYWAVISYLIHQVYRSDEHTVR